MSDYFSCIFLPDLQIRHAWWTTSHGDIVRALGLPDDKLGIERRFLRAGAHGGDMAGYYADEDDPAYTPSWYTENEDGYRTALAVLLAMVNDYKAKCAPLDADYEAKHAPLYADYEARRASLYADYATIPGAVAQPAAE